MGNLDIVQYLVEQGADIHANNDTALLWSVASESLRPEGRSFFWFS
jgi:ankyrin repeat protein